MIRLADIQDKEELLRGFRAFRALINDPMQFPVEDYDIQEQRLCAMVQSSALTIYVEDKDSILHGGIGLVTTPSLWNPNHKYIEELFFFCHDTAPKYIAFQLLRCAINLAKLKSAMLVMHSLVNSDPKLHDVYNRIGLHLTHNTYQGQF